MAERLSAVWHALRYLGGTAGTAFVALFVFVGVLLTGATMALGVGWLLAPRMLDVLHQVANHERRRVGAMAGELPEVAPPAGTMAEQLRTARRDFLWLVTHAFTGHVVGLLGWVLPASAVNAVLVPFYWWAVPANDPVMAPFPVTSWGTAALMPPLAVAYAGITLVFVPWLGRRHARLAHRLLSPAPGTRLVQRVAELTASRAAALEAHGAELRRIERDLHDGTQNRIVAVAMHLGIVERALRRDPAMALPLVLKARDAADEALAGLRDVVRSIYPPVLAERGLDGAIAGLIARCPVPCSLVVDGLRRAPAAVESAAYFVVAEGLTNLAKHSGATRAEVRLSGADRLVIEVFDDGHGGADEAGGTGLSGIRRRVAAFDGVTSVSSPDGGPTVLRVELPYGS